MTSLTTVKLAAAGVGIVVWGTGVRLGMESLKWGGIALLALAFLLRFGTRRDDAADRDE